MLKLRVVDVAEWEFSTNSAEGGYKTRGEYFADLPTGWDTLDDAGRNDWMAAMVVKLGLGERRTVREVVDIPNATEPTTQG